MVFSCRKKSTVQRILRVETSRAIPIRPVPGKIRHSNLVFYFHEFVAFSANINRFKIAEFF